MMKKPVFILFLGMLMVNICLAQSAKSVVAKMLSSIDNCKTLSFDLETRERFGAEYIEGMANVKMQINPTKLYIKQHAPTAGIEILYVHGENNNKAVVNPPGPIKGINLSPNSGRMRKNNHHSILEIGFSNVAELVRQTLKEIGDDFDQHFRLTETLDSDGNSCYLLFIEFDDFKLIEYTLEVDKTPEELANERLISEYKILKLNRISSLGKIKAGTKLTLPNRYTDRIELYLNKTTYLPISQALFDENGLFERYEYKNIKVNPTFKTNTFDKANSSYGF